MGLQQYGVAVGVGVSVAGKAAAAKSNIYNNRKKHFITCFFGFKPQIFSINFNFTLSLL